jgi:hypothetical protein
MNLTSEQQTALLLELQAKLQAMEAEKAANDAKLAALEAEKAEAEKAAALEAERKAEAEKNGGFLPGVHNLGFPCLVPLAGDLDVPFHHFKVSQDTVVLRLPEESTRDGKKTVWGPELLFLPPGQELAWSPGGPKYPLSTGNYLSASGGSGSSKYDEAGGICGTQIGTLLTMVLAACQEDTVFVIGADVLPDKAAFQNEALNLLGNWFSSLIPGKQTRKRFQPR